MRYSHAHDHDPDHPHVHEHCEPCGVTVTPRFWVGLGALLVLAICALAVGRTIFFADETQYVYVTQFGKPVRLLTQPGLGIKWPYQSLWRLDRRLHVYEPLAREMLTEDKENLDFDWYACWRVPSREFVAAELGAAPADPQVEAQLEDHVRRFLQSIGTVAMAESRLEERIQAALAAEIGRTRLAQLVSLEPGQVQLDAINDRVTKAIRLVAAEQFGIEVVDVRLKRFNYPEAVKPAVFAEIRSERESVAVLYRAEGLSQKTKIESLANLQRDQILAQAKREATRIRGEGEARAIEIANAAHGKNPEFYELLKTLETYRTILDEQTTVVLSADSPLLKLLTRGLPALENSPPTQSPAPSIERPLTGQPTSAAAAPLPANAAAGPSAPGRQEQTP